MAYIGVQPTDTYLSIASQQITGTGSATYTLDYSVSNEEDVAVFVNNVRQNVSTYTVSGDQLTLGGTISASDSCWVLFLGRTVGTKTPAVGSVTNDMLAGSIANSKLANSSITLNGSAVSLGGSSTITTGKVLQVVSTVASGWDYNNSMGDGEILHSGATITPSATSSKILIFGSFSSEKVKGSTGSIEGGSYYFANFFRGSTNLQQMANAVAFYQPANSREHVSASYLDSPNSTSSLTYKILAQNVAGGGSARFIGYNPILTLLEIGA